MTGFGDRLPDLPELLAAYADGELDAAGRARVEAWLAEHPDAREELESQRRLSRRNQRLWQATYGPQPSESSWLRLLTRIHDALIVPPRPTPAAPRRLWLRYAAAAAAVAVAVILAVGLLRPTAGLGPVSPPEVPALAVATDADVEIISVLEAEVGLLAAGKPPLAGELALATPDDVTGLKMDKDTDGVVAKVMMPAAPNAPMVVAAPMAGR
jgi:anti-sigma factor RsiW